MSELTQVRILTVDDNDALRYSLSRALREGGYHVIEARNGTEALALADQIPDLITLDIHLPDVDGFEVCRRLKGNPLTAHIPVLHISATLVDSEYRVRGLEGGADAYLAEPIARDELLATVRALLRMKQAERDARQQTAEAQKARADLEKLHRELELRVQERTTELAQKADEIRELTGQLLKSQDDERRRLARELHDSTGQMLVSLNLTLDNIREESKKPDAQIEKLVSECVDISNEMSRQLRTMSYLLHPPLLDETGLHSALEWYVEGFVQRSSMKVKLELSRNFGRLSNDAEIALFRVVQESLTNIHRHSSATSASISLNKTENNVQLKVTDNGQSSSSAATGREKRSLGVGIMGMQERMRQLGGTFEVEFSGSGTVALATLPLNSLVSAK